MLIIIIIYICKIYLAIGHRLRHSRTHLPCFTAQRRQIRGQFQKLGLATAAAAILSPLPSTLPSSLSSWPCHLVSLCAVAKSVAHVAACHFRICGPKNQKPNEIKKKRKFYIYIHIYIYTITYKYVCIFECSMVLFLGQSVVCRKCRQQQQRQQQITVALASHYFLFFFFFCIWPLALTRQNHKRSCNKTKKKSAKGARLGSA